MYSYHISRGLIRWLVSSRMEMLFGLRLYLAVKVNTHTNCLHYVWAIGNHWNIFCFSEYEVTRYPAAWHPPLSSIVHIHLKTLYISNCFSLQPPHTYSACLPASISLNSNLKWDCSSAETYSGRHIHYADSNIQRSIHSVEIS